MVLLEREAFSGSLESWLAAARNGEGCMVLVGGEAGIGKTALVRSAEWMVTHVRTDHIIRLTQTATPTGWIGPTAV
jgi:predicted ATPase